MHVDHDTLIKLISFYTTPESDREMIANLDKRVADRIAQSDAAEINTAREDPTTLLRDKPISPFMLAVAAAPPLVVEAFLGNDKTDLKTTIVADDGYKYGPIAFAFRHARLRDQLAGKDPARDGLNPDTIAVIMKLISNPSISSSLTKTDTALEEHPYTIMHTREDDYYTFAMDLLHHRNLYLAATRQEQIIESLQSAASAIAACSPTGANKRHFVDAAKSLNNVAQANVLIAFNSINTATLFPGSTSGVAGCKDIETVQCAQKQVALSLVARHLNEMQAMTPEERITALNATAEHLRLC